MAQPDKEQPQDQRTASASEAVSSAADDPQGDPGVEGRGT